MYSPFVKNLLKRNKVKIGDRIIIEKDNQIYEGLLMPRIELGDKNSLVIKVSSGYNIGINAKGVKIKKSKHRESKEIKEEVKFEMGKEKFKKIKFDPEKPAISLISTGGTIISKVDYKTGGVKALEKPEELLANVPELKDIVNIKHVLTPFNKMSEDIDYKDWIRLANLTAKELNKNKGVIITHGTDTMHFTSAALSFMLKTSKPVVLTGAQRSSDRGSSDAWMNLICSAYAAISDIGEVMVCMHSTINDDYCSLIRGVRVRKMHTTRRDTFKSLRDFPLANVWTNGKFELLTKDYMMRRDDKVLVNAKFEPKVALLKVYPNSDPDVLEYYISKKYKGFVIEGTGMGHVPTQTEKSWIKNIKRIAKNYPVVIVPQTLFGRINRNVYANLRTLYYEANAIPGEDMIPEVAYIKLGWLLGHKYSLEKIRELMVTSIVGEITERSLV